LRFGYCFTLIGVVGFSSTRAHAEPVPTAAPSVQLADTEIAAALREQAGRAHTHRYVWTSINGALALGSFAVLPLVDRSSRPDFVVAGVGSVLGTVATFAFPLQVELDGRALDDVERLPPEERRRKLRELLHADATDERDRLALPWHVFNFGVSALAGGIIAFGFHHTLSGVTQGVSSFALGEAQLFTQPTRLTSGAFSGALGASFELRPLFAIQSQGVSLGLGGTW
jgi:hypothetical protein